MRKYTFIAILCFLACLPSRGQRTMSGSGFVEAAGRSTVSFVGASLSYGQYTMNGRWRASAVTDGHRVGLVSSRGDGLGTLLFGQAAIGGDYMHRLWCTGNRRFSAYGGGGLLLGIEAVDPLEARPNGGIIPYGDDHTFIYGPSAGVEAEWFVAGGLALTASAGGSFLEGSQVGLFFFTSSAGLRWNF